VIIAIDGPAGAGKSTVAKLIAKKLSFLYIDTGALYRALTLKVLEKKIALGDIARIIELAKNTRVELRHNQFYSQEVLVDGKDVTLKIRQPRITQFVSDIAKIKGVREVMLALQRNLAKQGNSVLDGRDIGTVVFPNADKKFYIDAEFKERLKRRYKELNELGQNVTLKDIESDVRNRDTIDSTRQFAPLKKAEDAIYIDTTDMTVQEVVKVILKEITGISNIKNQISK
jgi:cytidylate kinase